ncbi:ephrin type-A receptor 7-like [Corticium candelabrum]|uniref:ephrin type-A receptor 7-like n=1 Tax=Corticium candelabrum TaxID=121492 RepID=UPI002E2604F2|nr:ephrin type-A receptor 7-like [Corticium candelabrum]
MSVKGSETLQLTVNATSRKAEISELIAFTKYTVKVQAFTVRPGNLSKEQFGVTDQGLPSRPLSLHASNITASSFRLSWQRPLHKRGIITRYTIKIIKNTNYTGRGLFEVDRILNVSQQFSHSNLTSLISSLQPNIVYEVSVAAHTIKGMGNVSRISTKTKDTVWLCTKNFIK